MADKIPVFLINGFLEAGKTEFIKFTMEQEYFQTEGRTLLLLCEEGESEYEPAFLEQYRTTALRMEEIRDFNREYLLALSEKYRPERVIIEWNGLWNQDDLCGGPMSERVLSEKQGRAPDYELSLPENWEIYQIITIIDGSTLELYLGNMKSYLGQMLRNAELAVVNRCDNISNEKLVDYRRKIRAMGQNAMIVMEDKEGEIPQSALPEELPYDLNAERIDIKAEDYGTWFLDCMDNPERYLNKKLSFAAMVLKRRGMPENEFIPGRMAMTCCAADMSFLGFVCKGDPKELAPFHTRDWVKLSARVKLEEREEYRGIGPVLYLESIARTGEIKEPVSF